MEDTQHVSVLLQESIDGLNLAPDNVFLDCTFGAGGHSSYACNKYKGLKIVALDQDTEALDRGNKKFETGKCDVTLLQYNFKNLDKALESVGISKVNGILFDLGTSVDQIKTSGRGFTFEKNEPLLMTLTNDTTEGLLTAKDIVNVWSVDTLETILRGYGEERFSRRIAEAIVEAREDKPIETTFELVEVIKKATPKFYHFKKIHPATKTFQAIRIAVNDEVTSLKIGLQKGYESLEENGRMAVISFHSIEDREVKRFFRDLEKEGKGKRITKKPIKASDQEISENSRSRSAKLRIFQK